MGWDGGALGWRWSVGVKMDYEQKIL